jgi:hypothetical protein
LVSEPDKYELSKARIIVGKVRGPLNLEYVRAKNGIEEDLTLELNGLHPGSYIAFLQLDWIAPTQVSSFVLSAFSDQPLNLEAGDKSDFQLGSNKVLGSLLDDLP